MTAAAIVLTTAAVFMFGFGPAYFLTLAVREHRDRRDEDIRREQQGRKADAAWLALLAATEETPVYDSTEYVKTWLGPRETTSPESVDQMQAALREFANPTPPKPERQQVVLELDGRHAFLPEFLRFVATHADSFNAVLARELADQIDAQISEGVQP